MYRTNKCVVCLTMTLNSYITEMKTKDPNVFGYRFPKNKNSNIETSDKKIMIKTFLFY